MKNEFIKKANKVEEYTLEQVMELQRCATDPLYFMQTYMKVLDTQLGAIPFKLYDYQIEAVKSFQANDDTILLMGRQQGKTTIIAAYLLWFASFHEEKYILVASKDNDAAMDVLQRIQFGYEELPMWLKAGCVYNNRHELTFDNGSTIKSSATTENTGRGRSVALLMIDELAFVKQEIQQKMWTSLAPTLGKSGNKTIISSTPNGDQDLFAQLYREATAGVNSFHPIFAPWDKHPDRDQTWFDRMQSKVGELMARQEYACEFLSSDPMLISSLVLNRMRPVEPLFEDNGFKFWAQIEPRRSYITGADVSEGLGQDYAVIELFDAQTLEQIAELRSNKLSEAQLYDKIKWLFGYILSHKHQQTGARPSIMWSYENNSCGKVISTLYYNDMKFPDGPELISLGEKLGMNTSYATKSEACKDFKRLVEQPRGFQVKSRQLIEELKNYAQVGRGATYAAKKGATDDLISACLITTRLFKYVTSYDDDAFDKLYRGNESAEGDAEMEILPMPVA